ncbi:VOC family protein [Acidocella sp. KAb 2-4]|uniref:VOC family protein n=1 Tax=Acidocella sp. KAb 2-4 TaxID=2885158 RepID=UPI001D08DFF0|nr:VOC family protein [Acidocella sp. KAb 2-4]MCB5945505.1 VOC family protein [Acidocella sp. KAb 2-4]
MSEIPKYIGRRFDQISFVVRDLDEAMEFWRRTNGIEAWDKAIDLAKSQTEKEYWGKPGNFQFSCAYGFAGDTLIELARHDGGDSIYKEWLDQHGVGPHHVGFRFEDEAEYNRAQSDYLAAGLVKAMGGFFKGPHGDCRWSYWDTRKQIGCYTELYYLTGELAARLARLKAGEAVSITF